MEQTTLLIQEDDLHWFDFLREFTGSDIGVHVENLAIRALGQATEDGKAAGTNRSLERALVDLGNLSDQTILLLVEVVTRKDPRCDGTSTGPEFLKGGDNLEVLFEKYTAGDLERLCV